MAELGPVGAHIAAAVRAQNRLNAGNTVQICLVEDEIDLSNLIKTYLEKAGYHVTCFTKGNDAINYIGSDVDLWILDIMLGDDVNGYDIIKEIRKKERIN